MSNDFFLLLLDFRVMALLKKNNLDDLWIALLMMPHEVNLLQGYSILN